MKFYLSEAIWKLRPNSEFTYQNQDYSTVQWISLEGDAPTQAEIDATIEEIKAEEIEIETQVAAKKIAAETKLAALGLTLEDFRALTIA